MKYLVVFLLLLLVSCGNGGGGSSDNTSVTPEPTHNDNDGGGDDVNNTVTLEWDANPESDNVTGYKIYVGTESGAYTRIIDVGNVTTYTFTDLVKGVTYYFVATAVNDDGESDYSNEISWGW